MNLQDIIAAGVIGTLVGLTLGVLILGTMTGDNIAAVVATVWGGLSQ